MNKFILVTGGAGYIGSHICKALANAGYTPVTYDNMINGNEWAVKWGPLEVGDILDQEKLSKVFSKYNPDAVMHFAAYAYVGESVTNPGKYYRNNVSGTNSLLECMRINDVDKIIFSSSCATYGMPNYLPIDEKHPQVPINPYGMSKLMSEKILKDFDVAYGIKSIALRYFNAAGADPDGQIGEYHKPETHLIPLILDTALGRRKKFKIFGDKYNTQDGTCIRDFIHVTDLANAHVLALKALFEGSSSTSYNLGNGNGFSVYEVINAAESVTNKKIQVEVSELRIGDPPQLIGDATRIKSVLGWDPAYTDLKSIITTAWEWYKRIH